MPKYYVILEASFDFADVACAYVARKPCQKRGSICLPFDTYQEALSYILASELTP